MIAWLNAKLISCWKDPLHLHSMKGITFGMLVSGLSTALALLYGSQDASQHAMLPRWANYLVFFIIFTGCFIGRLWKQEPPDDK